MHPSDNCLLVQSHWQVWHWWEKNATAPKACMPSRKRRPHMGCRVPHFDCRIRLTDQTNAQNLTDKLPIFAFWKMLVTFMEKLTTRMQIRYLYYVTQFVDRYLENLQDWSDQSNSYGPPFPPPPPPHPREKKKKAIKLVKRMTSIEEVRSYLSVGSQCSSHYNTSQSHSNVKDYTFAIYTHLPPGYRWCFCREGHCGTEPPGSRASTSSAGATPALLWGNVCWAPPCATCNRLPAESVSMKNAHWQEK